MDRFELCLQGVGFDGVGWRLYGAEFVDFPAAEGWSQIQGVRGSCGGAPAYVLAVVFVKIGRASCRERVSSPV